MQIAETPSQLLAFALSSSIVATTEVSAKLPFIMPDGSFVTADIASVAATVAVVTIQIMTPAVGASPIAIASPTPVLCH
jgi:hypothetical protein